jgi:mRNA interferase HicA
MKRKDLVRYIEENGCVFIREGARHTVYLNKTAGSVPPYRDIPK